MVCGRGRGVWKGCSVRRGGVVCGRGAVCGGGAWCVEGVQCAEGGRGVWKGCSVRRGAWCVEGGVVCGGECGVRETHWNDVLERLGQDLGRGLARLDYLLSQLCLQDLLLLFHLNGLQQLLRRHHNTTDITLAQCLSIHTLDGYGFT